MKHKLQVIDNTQDMECYKCLGKGHTKVIPLAGPNICSTCKGTGIWKEEHFYLVTNGMAFDVDSLGK